MSRIVSDMSLVFVDLRVYDVSYIIYEQIMSRIVSDMSLVFVDLRVYDVS